MNRKGNEWNRLLTSALILCSNSADLHIIALYLGHFCTSGSQSQCLGQLKNKFFIRGGNKYFDKRIPSYQFNECIYCDSAVLFPSDYCYIGMVLSWITLKLLSY